MRSYPSHLPQCYHLSGMDTKDYSEGWRREGEGIATEDYAPAFGRLGIEEDCVTFRACGERALTCLSNMFKNTNDSIVKSCLVANKLYLLSTAYLTCNTMQ